MNLCLILYIIFFTFCLQAIYRSGLQEGINQQSGQSPGPYGMDSQVIVFGNRFFIH